MSLCTRLRKSKNATANDGNSTPPRRKTTTTASTAKASDLYECPIRQPRLQLVLGWQFVIIRDRNKSAIGWRLFNEKDHVFLLTGIVGRRRFHCKSRHNPP